MNAMAACADACSNSTGSGLEALAGVQMRIACIALWLLFVAVNVALASYVLRGWRDSCGCINKCVWRAPVRVARACARGARGCREHAVSVCERCFLSLCVNECADAYRW